MATRNENRPFGPHGDQEGPYEHPALAPEPGYWDGRWAEFKRLFSRSWNNGYNKPVVIGSALVAGVTLFGMQFLGWR